MDPLDAFDDAFDLFGTLGEFGAFTPPTSAEDVLNQTVGEYRALLDLAEQSITSLDSSQFQLILNPPNIPGFVPPELDAETRAIIEAFAAGDFSIVTDGIDAARTAVAPYSDDTLLSDALDGIDPSGDSTQAIEQAFSQAETELAELLWNGADGLFTSPLFTIDPATGSWFTDAIAGQAGYSGSSLAEYYSALGDAISSALLAYIGSDDSLFNSLIDQGATADDFTTVQVSAQFAATQLLNSLQTFASELINDPNASPIVQEGASLGAYNIFTSALTGTLPGAASAIDDLIIGSRNAGESSFVAAFDGAVSGSELADWFFLSTANDSFDGGAGEDVLYGLAGDDVLRGGADDDYLFGGEGAGDLAEFAGSLSQFTIQLVNDGTVMITDRTGAEGTDILSGIEQLSFGGGASIFAAGDVNLSAFQGISSLNSEQINSFVELYIAYFNRAPDAIGLNFWGSAFAQGFSLDEITALFLNQEETRATYPEGSTNFDFATQVYSNVLGRAADQGGLEFWTGQLDSGNVTREAFILEVLKGAKADPVDGASQEFIDLQNGDRAYLETKTDIGAYFSVINGLSDVADASAAMQLFVRDDASSITAAIDLIDAEYVEALADGSGEFLMQVTGVLDDPFGTV